MMSDPISVILVVLKASLLTLSGDVFYHIVSLHLLNFVSRFTFALKVCPVVQWRTSWLFGMVWSSASVSSVVVDLQMMACEPVHPVHLYFHFFGT